MPVTDPRVKLGDNDADALTADVRTTDPAADTPALVVRVTGPLGTAPPPGAATATKQDEQTALLTTIDADTGAIGASTASIDAKTPADPATASAQAAQQARLDLLATQATLATLALETGGNLAAAKTDLDTIA